MLPTLADRGRQAGRLQSVLSKGFPGLGPLLPAFSAPRPFTRRIEPKIYGRIGNLEVRLARGRSEIRQAQRLRYQVFYEEMSAVPSRLAQFRRLDEDAYDALCEHLLVVDLDQTCPRRPGRPERHKVVGTYRILRQDVADTGPGFYSAGEYDIAPLLGAKARTHTFMELGRSCVLAPYRSKRSVELLWHGLWTYVREHGIDVMIGCASFQGIDPREHAMALSFLHHHALAPPEWRCVAREGRRVPMDMLPKDQVSTKTALKDMPPLVKAYMRLGAYVGDGAVVDPQFGTTDVLIILPVERIDPRYFQHFGAPDETRSRVDVYA